ncbi:MAG: ABC transporter ATP-binding protein [Bacteroidetes bacterium]|nr:ABC transporter ATP-binding protein [Bacteroidota bacterium]
MVVEVENLVKNYGKFKALRGISLNVPEGKIYGLIGPNGAGKSTLIKALVGSVKPTSGTVKVLGLHPLESKWKLREQLGYMPQSPALYDDLSAKDNIKFFARAKEKSSTLNQRVDEIIKFTELTERANDPVGDFSGGMKKRVSLACALIHDPQVIFLDEPTAAIDPHLKLRSWELFRELTNRGKTIFVSTHLMDEALLCDQITILREGEIITTDSPKAILEKGNSTIKISMNDGSQKEVSCPSAPAALAATIAALHVDASVATFEIMQDDLEKIILSIINTKK